LSDWHALLLALLQALLQGVLELCCIVGSSISERQVPGASGCLILFFVEAVLALAYWRVQRCALGYHGMAWHTVGDFPGAPHAMACCLLHMLGTSHHVSIVMVAGSMQGRVGTVHSCEWLPSWAGQLGPPRGTTLQAPCQHTFCFCFSAALQCALIGQCALELCVAVGRVLHTRTVCLETCLGTKATVQSPPAAAPFGGGLRPSGWLDWVSSVALQWSSLAFLHSAQNCHRPGASHFRLAPFSKPETLLVAAFSPASWCAMLLHMHVLCNRKCELSLFCGLGFGTLCIPWALDWPGTVALSGTVDGWDDVI
jgi:hypothetical protein